MKQNRFFTFRVLLACLPLLLCGIQAHAWDSQPSLSFPNMAVLTNLPSITIYVVLRRLERRRLSTSLCCLTTML